MADVLDHDTSENATADALRRIKLFRAISVSDSIVLLASMRRRNVDSGDKVFAQGENGDTMVVVLDGILRVEVTDMNGNTATVGKVEAGEVVGEMAVLDPAPRSASVVAATDCELLELSRADLMGLRRRAPSAAAAIVGGIIGDVTRRLRNVNKRIDAELDPNSAVGRAQMKVALTGAPTDENTGTFFGRIWDRIRR